MTGQLEELRAYLASITGAIAGKTVYSHEMDCPAEGVAVRCAAPLRLQADAGALCRELQKMLPSLTYLGVSPIAHVTHSGGHLLFELTGELYAALLKDALNTFEPVPGPGAAALHEDAAHARINYTIRRMWMLARKADATPCCPENPAVQNALLLTLAIPERFHHPRGLRLRLLAASDALLCMTRSVLPRLRPGLCRTSAHVAELSLRILTLGLITLYGPPAQPTGTGGQQ